MRLACPVFIQGALFWVLALSTIYAQRNYKDGLPLFQEKGRFTVKEEREVPILSLFFGKNILFVTFQRLLARVASR
ncbi:MAG TPA: hypothetical protein DCZ41_01630 [Firmicutes bacterium]|nr:hypothetical protein [Bacillota bacterium]